MRIRWKQLYHGRLKHYRHNFTTYTTAKKLYLSKFSVRKGSSFCDIWRLNFQSSACKQGNRRTREKGNRKIREQAKERKEQGTGKRGKEGTKEQENRGTGKQGNKGTGEHETKEQENRKRMNRGTREQGNRGTLRTGGQGNKATREQRNKGTNEYVFWKWWPMDELALLCSSIRWLSGEMCNQHNLHRTAHIQICKQDTAGGLAYRILRSFSWQTLETLF